MLKISAKDGLSDADLNEKLLEMAKDRGLANVYVVEAMAGSMDPRLLYKVTPDGKRTLVRGARLEDLDLRRCDRESWPRARICSPTTRSAACRETVLAPALLFDDITVRRANEKNEKLPFYPPPD